MPSLKSSLTDNGLILFPRSLSLLLLCFCVEVCFHGFWEVEFQKKLEIMLLYSACYKRLDYKKDVTNLVGWLLLDVSQMRMRRQFLAIKIMIKIT